MESDMDHTYLTVTASSHPLSSIPLSPTTGQIGQEQRLSLFPDGLRPRWRLDLDNTGNLVSHFPSSSSSEDSISATPCWTVHAGVETSTEDKLSFARVPVESVHACQSVFSLQIGATALLAAETEVGDLILAAFRANSPNELNLNSPVDLISGKLNTLSRHKLLLATTRFAKVNDQVGEASEKEMSVDFKFDNSSRNQLCLSLSISNRFLVITTTLCSSRGLKGKGTIYVQYSGRSSLAWHERENKRRVPPWRGETSIGHDHADAKLCNKVVLLQGSSRLTPSMAALSLRQNPWARAVQRRTTGTCFTRHWPRLRELHR